MLLSLLPNGDWGLSRLQIYIGTGPLPSRDEAMAVVIKGLLTVLFGKTFTVWRRDRWRGADLAVDRVGLLDACCGLGTSTFKCLNLLIAKKSIAGVDFSNPYCAHTVSAADMGSDRGEDLDDADSDNSEKGLPQSVDADQVGNGVLGASGSCSDAKLASGGDEIAENRRKASKSLRTAVRWWATRPLGMCIIIRCIMEPLSALLDGKFFLCSQEFEDRSILGLFSQEFCARRLPSLVA